ncbi:MAG: vitamin K epoxide reductase family protein [Vicinamibacterales bacterium]
MGRKAKSKKTAIAVAPGTFRQGPNWPLLALSLLGIVLAGYLSWTAVTSAAVQGCAQGGGCDAVLSSRWATLLGVPTAVWGLLTYLALAGAAFIRRADTQWRMAWTVALFGALYSVYLTTISLTMLGATCPYCLTSLALMTAILVVVTVQRPFTINGFSWPRWLRWRLGLSAALIVFLHLNYTGVVGRTPGVEDPMSRALAIHLAESGAIMYGAHWCEHCQQQKDLFGEAARRLPYIECSTGGQGTPQTAECRNRRINTYPTWFINGQRYEEVLTQTRLAALTGFKPPAPAAGGATP